MLGDQLIEHVSWLQNKKESMIKRQHEDVLQVLERQVIKIQYVHTTEH